jgi:hypothetical protein
MIPSRPIAPSSTTSGSSSANCTSTVIRLLHYSEIWPRKARLCPPSATLFFLLKSRHLAYQRESAARGKAVHGGFLCSKASGHGPAHGRVVCWPLATAMWRRPPQIWREKAVFSSFPCPQGRLEVLSTCPKALPIQVPEHPFQNEASSGHVLGAGARCSAPFSARPGCATDCLVGCLQALGLALTTLPAQLRMPSPAFCAVHRQRTIQCMSQ